MSVKAISLSVDFDYSELREREYRRTDITGGGYRVFKLMSLLPKAAFSVHITKIRGIRLIQMAGVRSTYIGRAIVYHLLVRWRYGLNHFQTVPGP